MKVIGLLLLLHSLPTETGPQIVEAIAKNADKLNN